MIHSNELPVDAPVHVEPVLLEGQALVIGDVYEARCSVEKDWVQAILLKFKEVNGTLYAVVDFCDNRQTRRQDVGISSDTIRSFSKKRERKMKYNLYEHENDLREMIGLKKLKGSNKKDSTEFASPEAKAKPVPVPRVLKAGMISIEVVRLAEIKCAQSLAEHTEYLKPFVSPKVYQRLISGVEPPSSPEVPPVVTSLVPTVSAESLANFISMNSVSADATADISISVAHPIVDPTTATANTTTTNTTSSSTSTSAALVVTPTTALNDPPVLLTVPSIIKATLRDYQVRGVSWLVDRYDRCVNCILTDEMGLGKTLQTITFFAYLKEVRREGGPHLVVVPLSVMFNWITELKKFCPSLRVLRAHSNQNAECKILREKLQDVTNYDVVVTSYEMLKGSLENAFHLMVWRSVTLDEGHRIKNMLTLLSKACVKLRARFKIILTGTPVQNNLSETYALLYYMMPTIFDLDSADSFANSFSIDNNNFTKRAASINTAASSNTTSATTTSTVTTAGAVVPKAAIDRKALDAAHYLMRPFVLRRVKTEVEEKLPSKLETLIRCPLSEMQRFWIKALLMRESSAIMGLQDTEEENPADKSSDWRRLHSLLAQLRKAANHPYLLTPAMAAQQVTEEIVSASGKMVILDRLLRKLHAKGHRVVIFSQFTKALDLIADFLDLRGYAHCRLDGSTHRVMREVLINQFNKPKSPYSVFCLSTRAGGEGVNLFTADTVVLFDSDWNPQVDIQAMARVHRIGQTKPVHIYRLVSQGTVEERIVQRAQKKLFLDCMVNRGSTAQGHEIDRKLQEARAARLAAVYSSTSSEEDNYWPTSDEGVAKEVKKEEKKEAVLVEHESDTEVKVEAQIKAEADDADDNVQSPNASFHSKPSIHQDENGSDELDATTVMSALKFGWNACFGAEGDAYSISDAALDAIIDRTRTSDRGVDALLSADNDYRKKSNRAARGGGQSSSGAQGLGLQEGQQSSVTQFEEAAPLVSLRNFEGEMVLKSKAKPSLNDISTQWITSSARARQSRLETTHVVNVGLVSVLKANNYTLEEGESSIFAKEAKRHRSWATVPKRAVQRYEHQDYCQYCWNYGSLICCAYCPASYHTQCVGLNSVPSAVWSCPHHEGCVTCGRKGAAAGFLFRCEMCPNSYCEDCLPAEHEFIGVCERWAELGFSTPSSRCYIHCSTGCADFAKM